MPGLGAALSLEKRGPLKDFGTPADTGPRALSDLEDSVGMNNGQMLAETAIGYEPRNRCSSAILGKDWTGAPDEIDSRCRSGSGRCRRCCQPAVGSQKAREIRVLDGKWRQPEAFAAPLPPRLPAPRRSKFVAIKRGADEPWRR